MDYITESAFFAYECQKSGEQVELESYINECLILAEGITKSSINNLVSFNEAERKGLFQRIKDVLKKFKEFIKRIFAKFSDKVSRFSKGNEAWLNKNRDIILNKPFKYDSVTMPNYFEGIKRMTQAAVPAFSNFENMKSNFVNGDGEVDDKASCEWMAKSINMDKFKWYNGVDFSLAVKHFLQGGENDITFTAKTLNLTDMFNYCYEYDKMAKNIKTDSTTIDTSIANIESEINEKIESIADEEEEKTKEDNQNNDQNNQEDNKSDNQNSTQNNNQENNKSNNIVKGATARQVNKGTTITNGNSELNVKPLTNSVMYSRVYDMPINEVEIGSVQGKGSSSSGAVVSNVKTGVAGDETRTASSNMTNINKNGKTDDEINTGNTNDIDNAKSKKELETMIAICNKYKALATDVFAAKSTVMEKCYKDFLKVLIAHVDFYTGRTTTDSKQTTVATDYSDKNNQQNNTTDQTNNQQNTNQNNNQNNNQQNNNTNQQQTK